METHCYLRGSDLGDHPLAPNEVYSTEVPIVVIWFNNLFCDITLGDRIFFHAFLL